MGPPRLRFLWDALEQLAGDLKRRGHRLLLRRGDPIAEIPRLIRETGAELLTFNRDPGPYAQLRDARVRAVSERAGARVLDCKDRVLFESAELRTRAGRPFRVYTPFRRAWLARSGRIGRCRPGRSGSPGRSRGSPSAGCRTSPSSVPPTIAAGSRSRARQRRADGYSASWRVGSATTRRGGKLPP